MTIKPVNIGSQQVGPGQPCFVIAEAGVNHNGSLEMAHELIAKAAAAGANAVKFQTFRAEDLATAEAPKAAYQRETTDPSESQLAMLKRLELSEAAHVELIQSCREKNILFLSTPFETASADFLVKLDVPAFKIPSGEITDLPFLEHVAQKQRPIILSTGMSTLVEVEHAVQTIQRTGHRQLVLLHCVSCYPARPADVNLRCIPSMSESFGLPVGFSDHTLGSAVSLAAVSLGACMLEKHLTLDRTLPGPDHRASLEPKEFSALIAEIRTIESALGDGRKRPVAAESDTARVARKSLVSAQEILPGTRLTETMVAIKRPGTGLAPSMLASLAGRTARVRIPAGAMLASDMFV